MKRVHESPPLPDQMELERPRLVQERPTGRKTRTGTEPPHGRRSQPHASKWAARNDTSPEEHSEEALDARPGV